jgi:hypothetical protein
MKKQQLEKALAALFILVASACFVNLQGQVSITFPNDSVDVGGGATDGIQPLSLKFTINDAGVISLDATSKNINEDVQKVVNGWDSDTVGITDNAALFGKSFALVATTGGDVRLQCRQASGGGLGVRGKNQWRLDDGGAEMMYWTLFGDVGVEFTSIAYNDFNDDGGNGNFRLMDFDSDTTVYLDSPQLSGDSLFTLPDGAISMRYQTDTLTLTNSDTISTSTGNEGGRIWGFSFDVVEAMPKPLPAGQIMITFPNPSDDVRYGNPDGLNPVTLDFTIDGAGNVAMDATSASENADNVAFVDTWDMASVGMIEDAALFNRTFSIELTTPRRLQCSYGGGLGLQGRNQWRIDDEGKEELHFTLGGEISLELAQFWFKDINEAGEDLAHFRWMDYDSDENYFIENWSGDIGFFDVPEGEMYMRYKTDMLKITTSDTIAGDAGGRLYGLVFNVMEALPKIPAVLSTMPAHADTLVPVTSDYTILFDAPMEQATTEAAIAFSPDVANRANAWNEAGDELTISFDDLSQYTMYTVTVGAAITGSNGLSALSDSVFSFQTLPEPPVVVYTYPVKMGKQLPLNTPIAIEFSLPMIPETVEGAISFEPALEGVGFVWSDDYKLVYMISDQMENESYEVTISTDATSAYGLALMEAYTFSFNTWAVGVEDNHLSGIAIYPNPASDMFQVRGMEVASVKIFSLTGQLIKEVHHSAVIDVSDLKPGNYAVLLSDMEDNRVRKMIVIE